MWAAESLAPVVDAPRVVEVVAALEARAVVAATPPPVTPPIAPVLAPPLQPPLALLLAPPKRKLSSHLFSALYFFYLAVQQSQ